MTVGAGKLLSITAALCGLGLFCMGITAEWLQPVIDAMTQIALGLLYVVGGGSLWALAQGRPGPLEHIRDQPLASRQSAGRPPGRSPGAFPS